MESDRYLSTFINNIEDLSDNQRDEKSDVFLAFCVFVPQDYVSPLWSFMHLQQFDSNRQDPTDLLHTMTCQGRARLWNEDIDRCEIIHLTSMSCK